MVGLGTGWYNEETGNRCVGGEANRKGGHMGTQTGGKD